MELFLFKVTETYYSDLFGLILLPGFVRNYVTVGTPVTIVRPDNTEIETFITGITFENLSITVEKSITTKDVPVGSTVWARKFLKYDLEHYILVSKRATDTTFELVFTHRHDEKFIETLKLVEVAGINDQITDGTICNKLRIDMDGSCTYALDIAIRQKNDAISKYPEVLIFLDKDFAKFCFRGVAKEISFDSHRINAT